MVLNIPHLCQCTLARNTFNSALFLDKDSFTTALLHFSDHNYLCNTLLSCFTPCIKMQRLQCKVTPYKFFLIQVQTALRIRF